MSDQSLTMSLRGHRLAARGSTSCLALLHLLVRRSTSQAAPLVARYPGIRRCFVRAGGIRVAMARCMHGFFGR